LNSAILGAMYRCDAASPALNGCAARWQKKINAFLIIRRGDHRARQKRLITSSHFAAKSFEIAAKSSVFCLAKDELLI
jgi:hypothetical protein